MRLHLFEWEDQAWFPVLLRTAMTSYLTAAYEVTQFPKLWAERLATLMKQDQSEDVLDLGSGSGGPIIRVLKELEERGLNVRITLTDLFPQIGMRRFALSEQTSVKYWPHPLDAAYIPSSLPGIRTMFASFHHFPPKIARAILHDAFQHRRTICIFEASSRTLPAILSTLLIPLFVLLLTPRIKHISLIQIALTYVVPILPFLIFWDGLVSHLRTYSVSELIEFTRELVSPDYEWEIGLIEIPRMPGGTPFLVGQASTRRRPIVRETAPLHR
jgi:hypothetical protein